MSENSKGADDRGESFAVAATGSSGGVFREFGHFLLRTKKWWLLPIVLALLMIGVIAVLGAGGAAPFIYTLF